MYSFIYVHEQADSEYRLLSLGYNGKTLFEWLVAKNTDLQ